MLEIAERVGTIGTALWTNAISILRYGIASWLLRAMAITGSYLLLRVPRLSGGGVKLRPWDDYQVIVFFSLEVVQRTST